MKKDVSRRAVALGAAWSLPTMVIATAAPALAGSEDPVLLCDPMPAAISRTMPYYPQRSDAATHTVTLQSDTLQWPSDVQDYLDDVNSNPSQYDILLTNATSGKSVHIDQVNFTWSTDNTSWTPDPVAASGEWKSVSTHVDLDGQVPITKMAAQWTLVIPADQFSETDPWNIAMNWSVSTHCSDSQNYSTTKSVSTTAQGAVPLGDVDLYGG